MAGEHHGGWRPLSQADDVAPEPLVAKPPLPPGTPWPLGSIVFLACLWIALLTQVGAGWADEPLDRAPSGLSTPTLALSEQLGTLQAGQLDPGVLLTAPLLQSGGFSGAVALLALLLLAPLAQALRGRAVALELWALTLALGQIGQELDPLGPPGDGVAILPLLFGLVGGSALALRRVDAEASHARVLAWVAVALTAAPVLLVGRFRPAFALAAVAVAVGWAFAPRLRGFPAAMVGLVGLFLWGAGSVSVLAASVERPPSLDSCRPPEALPGAPRPLLRLGHQALGMGCFALAERSYLQLERRVPSVREGDYWDNNLAWTTALANHDDPEALVRARGRAELAVRRKPGRTTEHTLATVQVLQGDLSMARAQVHRLADGNSHPDYIGLSCLLHLGESDAEGVDEACRAFVDHPDRLLSDLQPVVFAKLKAHPLGAPLLPSDD